MVTSTHSCRERLASRVRSGALALPAAVLVLLAPAHVSAQDAVAPAAAVAGGETSSEDGTELSEDEIKLLFQRFSDLSPAERDAMIAVYEDLGIELGPLMDAEQARVDAAEGGRPPQLMNFVQRLQFAREPAKVLAAQTRIGINPEPIPLQDAPPNEQADWMHRHVMAGEWGAFKAFLVERAGEEAEQVYSHVIQSTNDQRSELLPEDVLGLAGASPVAPTDWQVDALGGLLKRAAEKSSVGPFLAELKGGTTWFGPAEESRDRTARLLLKAEMALEAFEYLPSLEQAREDEDLDVLIGHAGYRLALARIAGDEPERDRQVRAAWDLYGEGALMEGADFTKRLECLTSVVDLLPRVPPAPGREMLGKLFDREELAAAALEAVALNAMQMSGGGAPNQGRRPGGNVGAAMSAQAILTMKEAVDTLLERESFEIEQLRVPLRMLTIGLVTRAEAVIQNSGGTPGVQPVTAQLLRAIPNEQWRQSIEPSLSSRAYKAFIGIALVADETDQALELLASGIEASPDEGEAMAELFLNTWVQRLRTQNQMQPQNRMFYYYGNRRPAAPLTRGRQRRNLDRLVTLLDLLEGIGVDGRAMPSVVTAFGACHGRTESFERKTLERVLGPVEGLDPAVAARMAESMRSGLNGDWRNREAQRDAGFQRSESELRAIVERGYDLAIDLIDTALANADDSEWQNSLTKAGLAYDRMGFRGEKEQDAAAYHAARKELFGSLGEAADRYHDSVVAGEIRPNPAIFMTWFSLSLGSSDLGAVTVEDLLSEGIENADQIDLIRAQILRFDDAIEAEHLGAFANQIVGALPGLQAAVKPRLIEAAARVVGEHPAGGAAPANPGALQRPAQRRDRAEAVDRRVRPRRHGTVRRLVDTALHRVDRSLDGRVLAVPAEQLLGDVLGSVAEHQLPRSAAEDRRGVVRGLGRADLDRVLRADEPGEPDPS